MAKLIWLFSPGYRFGGLRTLNMAMFRPKEAAVPLLLGLKPGEGAKDPLPFELEGLLLRIMRQEATEIANNKKGFSFIFDELNSLDIDTQGAMLRFLENAELTPLGGIARPSKDKDYPECAKNILVIGVMNENPHLIMKRQAMDRIFKQEEMLGTLFGQTLHELFRNQRRLRDDLYYRMIRGGEIIMPDLRERIEDIPILVHTYINELKKELFPADVRIEIELYLYDVLMDPSLQWEGNLRELQTLTRNLVLEAKADYDRTHPSRADIIAAENVITISGVHATRALRTPQDSGRL